MERDDEISRLKRMLVRQNMFFLLIIILVVAFFSYESKRLNDAIQLASNTKPKIIQGINGRDGLNGQSIAGPMGPSGTNGNDGAKGDSVTPEQIVAAVNATLPSLVSQYFVQNPVASIPSKDGTTPNLKVDTNCELLAYYTDLTFPVVLAQLPTPCEAQP